MSEHQALIDLIERIGTDATAQGDTLALNFADGNHTTGYAQNALADPKVLEALKNQAKISTLIVEAIPSEIIQKEYRRIQEAVNKNPEYSLDDWLKEKGLTQEKFDKYPAIDRGVISLMHTAAREDMNLAFVDNAMSKDSAGEFSQESGKAIFFIQGNLSILTKGHPECVPTIGDNLYNGLPQATRQALDEDMQKRMNDGGKTDAVASSNTPVIERANQETAAGNNVGVVYGVGHFLGLNDVNDSEQATQHPVILIASDEDLRSTQGAYHQAKELPQYRYDPQTGEAGSFDISHVDAAVDAVREPGSGTDLGVPIGALSQAPEIPPSMPSRLSHEECLALMPETLPFMPELYQKPLSLPDGEPVTPSGKAGDGQKINGGIPVR